MDLNTIEEVVRPRDRSEVPAFCDGDAFLAGGTWLYSEPQAGLRRLIDLTSLGWPALERTQAGLLVGATCPLLTLESFEAPTAWLGSTLIRQCCQALLGSFKIRRSATVGGNLCLALPASPMAALAVAMEGVCRIWTRQGEERTLPATALIVDAGRTVLQAGDILRTILLPERALRRVAAFRQISLTPLGRSAALLIGTRGKDGIALTVTASVARPVRLHFNSVPAPAALASAIDAAVPVWFDDVHGAPAWRRRVTHVLAADIMAEIAA